MDISTLKGDLQKILAINASDGVLKIDVALGLIGAYLLLKKYDFKDWKEMVNFLSFLRSDCFRGRKKSIIKDCDFSSCVSHIMDYLSKYPLESKKGSLLSFGLKLIVGVEDNGYLSFNDKTFNVYATQQIINGVPADNYLLTGMADNCIGDNVIENIDNNNVLDNSVNDEEGDVKNIISEADVIAHNDNANEQETTKSENPVLLATDNRSYQRNSSTDNNPFIQLYDKLIAANPENRKNARFVWQWFLTFDEYKDIKACLTNCKLPTPGKWDDKTTSLIALYIGEFYKREYENNVTPFARLGENIPNVNFRKHKEICEKLDIEPYKKDNQAHLHTLFVNGGLPVHFISSKLDNAQSNLFIDGLSKLLDAEDDIDILEGEEALGKVSNTALRESYQKGAGHSIYEYIQAIMAGNQTWDDSENNFPEFRNFIEKIREAKNKAAERKKFKLFYNMWTYVHESNLVEFSLQPQIRFNPEENGDRHYAISVQRLANWGITNPPAQFSLRLGDKEMTFTKCCNGDYISWDLTDRIDLNRLDRNLTTDDLLHSNFTIVFDRLNGESTQIRNDFNLPFKSGFLQFYTDDDPSMASWNSFKGAHSFLWSGLMYDKNRYHLLSPITVTSINEELGWVTFSDCVAFEDRKNGKIHSFFNSKGQIYAKLSEESLHRNIIDSPCLIPNCLLDGMAECIIGEERSHAYIVKSSNLKFDIFRVANDEKVKYSVPLVEYKSAQEYLDPLSTWKQYESLYLDQGLYVFRLYNARYSTEVRCLVLPDNAKIEFDNSSTPYLIKFFGFSNVSSEGVPSSERDNSIVFRLSNKKADSISFSIGDDNGSVSLQTYHPKPQIHVNLYGKEINVNDNPILIAYADEIEIKYISSDTCKTLYLCDINKIYKLLFNALTATVTGNLNQLLTQRININIEGQDNLVVRVYTQVINGIQEAENNSIKLMLLDLYDNSIKVITEKDTISQVQQIVKEIKHDGLLFQSLKNIDYTDVYYAPRFIPKNGQRLVGNAKSDERKSRLSLYTNKEKFASDYAFRQFEIACEHRIYFAVFDSLLSMCWNAERGTFLDKNRKPFKKNILNFMTGYLKYTTDSSAEPFVAGLKRLAREFLFDWKIIKDEVEKSDSQELKELYQEIISK